MAADDYTPPLNDRDEYELKFATPEGMFFFFVRRDALQQD